MVKEFLSIQMPVTRSQYLFSAIESVLQQTSKNWELVILVDGPPNNELEIIREILKKVCVHPKVMINFQKKAGISKTRQRLFKLTNCRYLLPLDDDDMLMPECVKETLECFQKNPKAAMVRGGCLEIGEKVRRVSDLNRGLLKAKFDPLPRVLSYGMTINPGNVKQSYGLNMAYLDKIGRLKTYAKFKNIEDVDLFLRIEEVGPIAWVKKILYLRRKHNNSLLSSLTGKEKLELLKYCVNNAIKRRRLKIRIKSISKVYKKDFDGLERYSYQFNYIPNP